jgi:uncharacterized protein YjiS (DUF1127 family)
MTTEELAIEQAKRIFELETKLAETYANLDHYREGVMRLQEINNELQEMSSIRALYDELIMAVARKFPGESRHQTALKYIREIENRAVWNETASEPKLPS